jgi:hypothetical protein
VCDPATGLCSYPALPTGTACDDGDACSQADTCQNGLCLGTVVVCTPTDACHDAGVCDPATGLCANPAKADGTACDDGDACTQADSCQAGVCQGANPVTCVAADACHLAGTCDPSTGTCSQPVGPDGAACDDGNGCTQLDTCQAGVCQGANPVTCAALDACHLAGACDPSTGVCSQPARPDGTACNDGNACTAADTCQAGICQGANPVTCTAKDACHLAGACDPATGVCSQPARPDGAVCNDGNACTQVDTCQAGACQGASPVTCAALDACHLAGMCNPTTGVCSNPARADGAACNDGDACTQGDTCHSGVCQGAAVGSFASGTVMSSVLFQGPTAATNGSGSIVPFLLTPLALGSTGVSYLGVSYFVFSAAPFSACGGSYYAIDGGMTVKGLASHSFSYCSSGPGSHAAQAFGASRYLFTSSYTDSLTGTTSYIDSDNGSFAKPNVAIGLLPSAARNLAGDLLVGSLSGADLRRLDGSGATVYTTTLGTAPPGPGVQSTYLVAGANGDAYVARSLVSGDDIGCGPMAGQSLAARMSPAGQCVWARSFAATVSSGVRQFLPGGAHDLFTGAFTGTLDLGCGPLTAAASTPYLAAVDAVGTCLWSHAFAGVNPLSFKTMLFPSGDALVAGPFTGTVDVGCGPLTSAAGTSSLVARLDAGGACVWSQAYGVGSLTPVLTPGGDVAVSGLFAGTVDLGAGPLTAAGVKDLAVARLDGATGATLWSRRWGGAGVTMAGEIAADASGGVLGSGFVSGPVSLGGAPINGGFVVRLDGGGAFRWQRAVSGRVASDSCGSVVVASVADDCASCFFKTPTILVQRIAP